MIIAIVLSLSVNHGISRFAREEGTLTIGDSRRILSSAARFSPDAQSTFLQVLMSLERILINKGGNNSYYLRGIVVLERVLQMNVEAHWQKALGRRNRWISPPSYSSPFLHLCKVGIYIFWCF